MPPEKLDSLAEEIAQQRGCKSDDELAALVYEDYQRREGLIEADLYIARFPWLEILLRRFFEVHEALTSMELSESLADFSPQSELHSQKHIKHTNFGEYQIIREISHGRMGTVYEAVQTSLNRTVAVKALTGLTGLNQQRRKRFLIEAQIAGTLQVDGIVPVISVGEEDGIPYYTMPYICGQTLTSEVISRPRERPPDWRRLALIISAVARAIDAAHERGIIHRDIKPSNILIDENGKPWVSDFGLARSIDFETQTRTGDVLGTYYYMCPEQISGTTAKIDRRSDVYSLGATLYELLSGHPPFHDQTPPQLLQAIAYQELDSLRRHRPKIPRDLCVITNKAMAKVPNDRFDTAADLAEELDRYAAGHPICTKDNIWQQGLRWCRRHQVAATWIALAMFTLIAGVFFGQQHRLEELGQLNSELQVREKLSADFRYAADMQLAYSAHQARNTSRARELVERHASRVSKNLELRMLAEHLSQFTPLMVLRGHEGNVNQIALIAGIDQIVSVGEDSTIRFWDLATGKQVDRIQGPNAPIFSVGTSPDGKMFAVGDLGVGDEGGTVVLWDLKTKSIIREITQHQTSVRSIEFSPDGTLIASGSGYEDIHLNSIDGELIAKVYSGSKVERLAFSSTGDKLFGSVRTEKKPTTKDVIRCWSIRDGQFNAIRDYEAFAARQFVITSENSRLVAASRYGGGISVFDQATGKKQFTYEGEGNESNWISTSPSFGLASAHSNGKVRIWPQLSEGDRRAFAFKAHKRYVLCARYTEDGRLVTCGSDGLIKIWPKFESYQSELALHTQAVAAPILSMDGGQIAFTDSQQEVTILNLRDSSRRTVATPIPVGLIQFSHGAKMLAIGGEDKFLVIRLQDDRIEQTQRIESHLEALAFSRDGKKLATGDFLGNVAVWDARNLNCIWQTNIGLKSGCSIAFSPDSRLLACGTTQERTCLLSVEDGSIQGQLRGSLIGSVLALAWSQDATSIAIGTDGSDAIEIWDIKSQRRVRELLGHHGGIAALAFSPNGQSLFSASFDHSLRAWNMATGEPAGTIYDDASTYFHRQGVYVSEEGLRTIATVDVAGQLIPKLFMFPKMSKIGP